MLTSRCRKVGLVQAPGNRATPQGLFDQQPIHVADDLSLARLAHDVRRSVMPSRQIAVAITMIGPRHIFAAAGFL
jgi:hypothetical protein